jgi:outer membrane protein assembly factor BamA
MFAFLNCIVLLIAIALPPGQVLSAHQQFPTPDPQDSDVGQFNCSQRTFEQTALIREAETDKYTTRRVEFIGNNYTRDGVLRRRIIMGLQEGELFTRQNLIKSLKNVSRLKIIYPARLRDVVIQLDRPGKMVNMIICFREKRRLPAYSR